MIAFNKDHIRAFNKNYLKASGTTNDENFKTLNSKSSYINNHKSFKWICWDADFAFNFNKKSLNHNSIEWAIRSKVRNDLLNINLSDTKYMVDSTFIIRKFLENKTFEKYFLLCFYDIINTYFTYENITEKLKIITSVLSEELSKDLKRWDLAKEDYYLNIKTIKDFAKFRKDIVLKYFKETFNDKTGFSYNFIK